MRKPITLFFLFYIWFYALTSCSVLRAEEVKSEKGVCEASGSLDWVELADYDGLFYSTKERTDRHGTIDTSNDWYDGVYSMLNTWAGALENCAGNDYEECSRIIEHMTHLSEQEKTLFNWSGREDWDHIWESTFWNNTSLVVLLNAYKVASDRVEVPADVHSQIGAWMKKAVKSNKQLYLAKVNKSFNNHQLQWARANAVYGLLWNDSKALKVSEKALNTFMKKNKTKEGALKYEAYRGSRGLWYHGRAYLAIFGIADTLEQAGVEVYDKEFKDYLNKSVNFYIDASADNTLIYKWAKRKKSNNGNYKEQEQASTGNAWVGAFINNVGKDYPATIKRLYESETINDWFFDTLGNDAGFWETLDSECFYPVYDTGRGY